MSGRDSYPVSNEISEQYQVLLNTLNEVIYREELVPGELSCVIPQNQGFVVATDEATYFRIEHHINDPAELENGGYFVMYILPKNNTINYSRVPISIFACHKVGSIMDPEKLKKVYGYVNRYGSLWCLSQDAETRSSYNELLSKLIDVASLALNSPVPHDFVDQLFPGDERIKKPWYKIHRDYYDKCFQQRPLGKKPQGWLGKFFNK